MTASANVRRPGLHALPALAKVGIVLAGYVAAVLLAAGAVVINEMFILPPDASDGMAAFGDFVLFVAVLCFASIFPTGLAVYFLMGLRKA